MSKSQRKQRDRSRCNVNIMFKYDDFIMDFNCKKTESFWIYNDFAEKWGMGDFFGD